MNKKIQDAINAQIKIEFESAYIYLAMSAHFEAMSYKGFAHWMRLQWSEETLHAMKLYDFLIRRDGVVDLQALTKPKVSFTSPLEAFEEVLAHEQFVTRSIHKLYALAVKQHDYPLQTLLHWFIDEQVEEEDNAKEIIDNLNLVGSKGDALYLIDRELGQRAPEPEQA